jgi:hypothetical protein
VASLYEAVNYNRYVRDLNTRVYERKADEVAYWAREAQLTFLILDFVDGALKEELVKRHMPPTDWYLYLCKKFGQPPLLSFIAR